MMNDDAYINERYGRQMMLDHFGKAGQQKLFDAKVLVIGAGGLGCPALQHLAACGVGTIGIIDGDVVTLSNLHRQILYTTDDIGKFKVICAKDRLNRMNPTIQIQTFVERFTNKNALAILNLYDIVVDGTDNFATKYLINDACVLLKKPFVFGAISKFEGQVSVLNYYISNDMVAVNYRDLFPVPPKNGDVLNCAEAGVLGTLSSMIGTMQANEVIKLITGIGPTLSNQLFTFNALTNQVYQVELLAQKNTLNLIPKSEKEFLQMEYELFCSVDQSVQEIDYIQLGELINIGNIQVIDVRELGEETKIVGLEYLRIPLHQLAISQHLIHAEHVVTVCQTGKRSKQAMKILSNIFGSTKLIYSLSGGIDSWNSKKMIKE